MIPVPAMQRRTLDHEGVRLSWLDSGGDGPVLLCLHALWMQAGSFAALADRLFPDWRVVAPDLRGHGQSGGGELTPEAFARDAAALIAHVGGGPVAVLGNSLGGTVAIVLAARHPQLVRAIVVEEGGVRPEGDLPFLDDWRGVFPDRAAFAHKAGPLYWSLAPSLVPVPGGGVRLGPDVDTLRRILDALQADRWSDWQATRCPALLVGGRDSRVMDAAALREIAAARPGVQLAMVDGGHVAHEDNLAGFLAAVRPFLEKVRS